MMTTNLVSEILVGSKNNRETTPEIGMGVTICVGSDRYVGTIVGMTKSKKTIHIKEDEVKAIRDKKGNFVKYEYIFNENACIKKARWSEKKKCYRIGGFTPIILDRRDYYYDPHF